LPVSLTALTALVALVALVALAACQPLAAPKAATRSAWRSQCVRCSVDETRAESTTCWGRRAGAVGGTAPRRRLRQAGCYLMPRCLAQAESFIPLPYSKTERSSNSRPQLMAEVYNLRL